MSVSYSSRSVALVLAILMSVGTVWFAAQTIYPYLAGTRVGAVYINRNDLQRRISRHIQLLKRSGEGSQNLQPVADEELRSMALEGIKSDMRLANFARDSGFIVPTDYVMKKVKNYPLFQNEQKNFDQRKLMSMLETSGMTLGELTDVFRQGYIDEQIARLIDALPPLPEYEANIVQKFHGQIATVDVVQIDKSIIAHEPEPTLEQMRAYYENNKEKYKTPEYVEIEYANIYLQPSDIKATVSLSPERAWEIEDAVRSMTTREKFRSVTLLKFTSRQDAQEALAALKDKADIALLSSRYGKRIEIEGLKIYPNSSESQLDKKAFDKQAGEYTEIYERQGKSTITFVDNVYSYTQEEVDKLVQEEVYRYALAMNLSEKVRGIKEMIDKGSTFDSICERYGLSKVKPNAFDAQGLTKNKKRVALLCDISNLVKRSQDEISIEPMELREGVLLTHVISKDPRSQKSFDESVKNIEQDLKDDLYEKQALSLTNVLEASVMAEDMSPGDITSKPGIRWIKDISVARSLSRGGNALSFTDNILDLIFSLAPGEGSGVHKCQDGLYRIAILKGIKVGKVNVSMTDILSAKIRNAYQISIADELQQTLAKKYP